MATQGAPQAGRGAVVCSLPVSGISWVWDESRRRVREQTSGRANRPVGSVVRVRLPLTQRPNQCLIIAHAFQLQHKTSRSSHGGMDSFSSSSGACTWALCMGNTRVFSTWEKHQANDYTHQLMDGHGYRSRLYLDT